MYIILTCSEYFTSSPRPCLFGAKDDNAGGVYTKEAYAGNTCIKDVLSCASNACTVSTSITSAYTKSTSIKDDCIGCAWTGDICARDTDTEDAWIKSVYASIICIENATAIKYLKIYLQ